jgi:hypothetical protein
MKKLTLLFLMLISFICNAQKEDVIKFIKNESIGGKLDFTKIAEEQAQGAFFIRYGNTLYNKQDFAILMWSAKVKSLGVVNFDKIIELWEEIHNRNLTEAENKALKTGFEIKIEN